MRVNVNLTEILRDKFNMTTGMRDKVNLTACVNLTRLPNLARYQLLGYSSKMKEKSFIKLCKFTTHMNKTVCKPGLSY